MSKAQITIFIIIGLIILGGATAYFFLQEKSIPEARPPSDVESSVTTFMQTCLQNTLSEGIKSVSEHGGYITPVPVPYVTLGTQDVNAILYTRGNASANIAKDNIERELSIYLLSKLDSCTNNFADFTKQGLTIETIPAQTNLAVTIYPDNVAVQADYPMTITQTNSKYGLKTFKTSVPAKLGKYVDIANALIEEQNANPYQVCISCLSKSALTNGYLFNLIVGGNNTYIVQLIPTEINEKPFYYAMVMAERGEA